MGGTTAAMPDWHGSLFWRAPLGAAVSPVRPHREADGAEVRHALSPVGQARQERCGYWKAVLAIAAKNPRLAWAVLKYGEEFRLTSTAGSAAPNAA